MNRFEAQLLKNETGGTPPRELLCTGTRVDTGRWWQRSRVWLGVMPDELILLAVGRRTFLERIAIADCPGTHYNHATGELVLEPAEQLSLPRLRMAPAEALRVLDLLKTDHSIPNT